MSDSEFKKLKAKHIAEGSLYRDTDFSAWKYAIRRDGNVRSNIKWKRPGEIVENPQFIRKGATRFDLDQGELGNCWFIAGAACISMYPKLFNRCVPEDQSFHESNYAGIFHFYFYRFGEWKEVIIDDRLPTRYGRLIYAKNREEPNEFWAALLEKAYAKLHGSYEAIDGGHTNDALVDMCGGVSERIDLEKKNKVPDNLFELMQRMCYMQSMMGCSITPSTYREEDLGNGLYTGHAYSITSVHKFNLQNKKVQLVRLRNPWGRDEWKGAWSDGSQEWTQLSNTDKRLYGIKDLVDGEFWMTFDDWLQNFHDVVFCHLSPDAHSVEVDEDITKKNWNVSEHYGEWIRGLSAGGCGNPPYQDLLWTNPQFAVDIKKADTDSDGKCTLVVSLMQVVEPNKDELSIGFILYKVRESYRRTPLTSRNYDKYALRLAEQPEMWTNIREKTIRYDLEPGTYVIIPSTFDPNLESRFFLRLYTETQAEAEPIDVPTEIEDKTEEEEDLVEVLFKKHANGDPEMDAVELKGALNEHLENDLEEEFGTESARCMVAMMDRNESGTVDITEFRKMLKEIGVWKRAFIHYDKDKSGRIDTNELSEVFKTIGFTLSRKVLSSIVKRYGGKRRSMDLKNFLHCCSKIVVMHGKFANFSTGTKKAEIHLEDWISLTVAF